LLWLLSAIATSAVAAPRAVRAQPRVVTRAQAEALVVKSLARKAAKVGSSLVRVRKVRASLVTRRAFFQRNLRRVCHADDDDAIQNDAPAAGVAVDLFLELRQTGVSVELLERQPFTLHTSPRSPRGPPTTA
jgi:hypothetical protein